MEPIEYPHPSLEPCLRSTYGLVVYEEHILQICEAFAGLPPGRADVLRRALNKQKRAVIAEIRGGILHRRSDCAGIRWKKPMRCGDWSLASRATRSAKLTARPTELRRINRHG
ncbi:MAG: hypothetical protein V9H26_26710 [Verrucomicrobiota bacterium]